MSYIPPHKKSVSVTPGTKGNRYIPPYKKSVSVTSGTKENRYKAVVLPKIGNNFVVVQDKNSQQYTFIVGGCRGSSGEIKFKKGNIDTNILKKCALRELTEETLGSVKLTPSNLRFIGKTIIPRSKQEVANNNYHGKKVTMHYIVYNATMNTNMNKIKTNYIRAKKSSTPKNNSMNETSNIKLMSRNEINQSDNTKFWKNIKQPILNVINNKEKTRR
jgi:hypothetical protein